MEDDSGFLPVLVGVEGSCCLEPAAGEGMFVVESFVLLFDLIDGVRCPESDDCSDRSRGGVNPDSLPGVGGNE